MLIEDLLGATDSTGVEGPTDREITGMSYDSRLVEPGHVFFCIKGLVTDGHLFAAQAAGKGAVAIVVERELDLTPGEGICVVTVPDTRIALARCSSFYYGDPSSELRLIGITGTNGKTTTAYLVENCCREAGLKTGLIGTVQNRIGDHLEPVVRTTPESLDLQRLLKRMVDAGVEVVAMEVSSHALELHRVAGCTFDTVVFTNLTQDHLDFHISIEEYFGAKRRLFEDREFGPGRNAVINVDDPFGRQLASETALETLCFGIDTPSDITAREVQVNPGGNSFFIEYGGRRIPVKTILQGRFNVYNCLAAAGACLAVGVDADKIVQGIENLKGVPGRFERIDCGQAFTVIVDYAHTPDGVRNLLEACREVADGRVIVVVGCGGDRDRGKRPLMGKVATELADLCIVTSDNPRSEDPMAIIGMVLEGIEGKFPPERYEVEADRRKAIFRAVEVATPGDLVVIAGKGHESGQLFADRVLPFDDRDVAREALKEVKSAEY